MLNNAKPLIMIFIMMSICCSCSVGQLGQSSSGVGAGGSVSIGGMGGFGTIGDGAGVFPANGISNGMIPLGGINIGLNIALREFVCNSMSACGIYERGKIDNSDGAIAYTGGVSSGATVPLAKL